MLLRVKCMSIFKNNKKTTTTYGNINTAQYRQYYALLRSTGAIVVGSKCMVDQLPQLGPVPLPPFRHLCGEGDAEFAGVENAAPYCSGGKRGSRNRGNRKTMESVVVKNIDID